MNIPSNDIENSNYNTSKTCTVSYRFGFNGKELDNEVSGTGNQYDYGFRIYNPRLGRFLSVDPLTASYPYYSPYHFAGNTPIQALDLDGLEILDYRSAFVAKITTTKLGVSYSLEIVTSGNASSPDIRASYQTLDKMPKGSYNIRKSMVGIRQTVIKDPELLAYLKTKEVPVSTNNGRIYDPNKEAFQNMMGRPTEMEDNPVYEYTGNSAPAKLNAMAFSIEFGSKWLYTLSPVYQKELANQDFGVMSRAYNQAFNVINKYGDHIYSKVESMGYNKDQFLSDLMNYIVDGKSPVSEDKTYSEKVKIYGDILIKNGNDQQKELNSD